MRRSKSPFDRPLVLLYARRGWPLRPQILLESLHFTLGKLGRIVVESVILQSMHNQADVAKILRDAAHLQGGR